ncbi:hypothetical protein SpCBS45565_g02406 [Spizellomyces sp. 'palustris']|nr:hypothetical protein SpCBS45565_g02406 [Spizellomyces sp. 'palustris']
MIRAEDDDEAALRLNDQDPAPEETVTETNRTALKTVSQADNTVQLTDVEYLEPSPPCPPAIQVISPSAEAVGQHSTSGDQEILEQQEETQVQDDDESVEEIHRLDVIEGLDVLERMKEEQGEQLVELERTKKALMELQRKRIELEFIRSTIVDALGRNDIQALEDLNAQVAGLEDDHNKTAMTAFIEDAKALASEEYLTTSSFCPRSSNPSPDIKSVDSAELDDIMKAIDSISSSDLEVNPALKQLVELKQMHEIRDTQLRQLQTLREQYELNEERANEQLGVFAERQAELEELRDQFASVKAMTGYEDSDDIVPGEQGAARQALEILADADGQDHSRVAALRRELAFLEDIKRGMDAKKKALQDAYPAENIAVASADQHSKLRSAMPGQLRVAEAAHVHFQQNEDPRELNTNLALEELMERLKAASVAGNGKMDHAEQRVPSHLQYYARDDEQGAAQSVPEDVSDADIQNIEQGMQEVLAQMGTVEKAREMATDDQKQQFDDLFARLKGQLGELVQVQNKVTYFRNLLKTQASVGHSSSPQERNMVQVQSAPSRGRAGNGQSNTNSKSLGPNFPVGHNLLPYDHRSASPGQYRSVEVDQTVQGLNQYKEGQFGENRGDVSWVEAAEVDEYDIKEEVPDAYAEESNMIGNDMEPSITPEAKRLFDQCKDKIYRCAASLISKHETEPYFLLQLFRGAEKLGNTYLRQRLLLALDDVLEEAEGLERERGRGEERSTKTGDLRGGSGVVREQGVRRRRERSAAPSPSPGMSVDRHVDQPDRLTAPAPNNIWIPKLDVRDPDDLIGNIINNIVTYISRLPTPLFTSSSLYVIKLTVLSVLAPFLHRNYPTVERAPIVNAVGRILEESLSKYINGTALELESEVVDEVIGALDEVLGAFGVGVGVDDYGEWDIGAESMRREQERVNGWDGERGNEVVNGSIGQSGNGQAIVPPASDNADLPGEQRADSAATIVAPTEGKVAGTMQEERE